MLFYNFHYCFLPYLSFILYINRSYSCTALPTFQNEASWALSQTEIIEVSGPYGYGEK